MKKHDPKFRLVSTATLLGAFCFGVALAGDGKQTAPKKADAAAEERAADSNKPVYTPPRRGAPRTRVGGGTRGGGNGTVVLQVLAPEHTGLTTQAQPTLYWYASRAFDGEVEFVLTERDAVAPVWRHRIDGRFGPGIQPLALQDAGLDLEPGVEYQWSVAAAHGSGQRARDVVAIGTIVRIPDATLPEPASDPAERAAMLAANGIWYDAIQILCESIGRDTESALYQSYRRDLLEQVGLLDVAYGAAVAANY